MPVGGVGVTVHNQHIFLGFQHCKWNLFSTPMDPECKLPVSISLFLWARFTVLSMGRPIFCDR